MSEQKTICPICRSDKAGLYGHKDSYDFWLCPECDLVFVFPIPGHLEQVYSKEYFLDRDNLSNFGFTDYDQDKESMREFFSRILSEFEKLAPGRRIFDVGAATGFFLDLAKKRSWQTAGTEISEYAAQTASGRGHNVQCIDLNDLASDVRYDVVTMLDVLEHVSDPQRYLSKANELLVDGGILAINTIDRGSLIAKLFGLKWHLVVPPEHLIYYTRKNLELMLEQNGFQILSVTKPGKKFSLSYIFKMLHTWQGWNIWHVFSAYFGSSFWRHASLPINLRDNIYIVARKIPKE